MWNFSGINMRKTLLFYFASLFIYNGNVVSTMFLLF